MTTRTGILGTARAAVFAGASGSAVYVNDRSGPKQTIVGETFVDATLNTGSAASTLAALTGSATGALLIQGTAASTLAALTSTEAGALLIQGSEGATLDALTGSSTATLRIAGAAAATLDALTGSATATMPVATDQLSDLVQRAKGSGGVSPRRRRRRDVIGQVAARIRSPRLSAAVEAGDPPEGRAALPLAMPRLRASLVAGIAGRARLFSSRPSLRAAVDVTPCGDARLQVAPQLRAVGRHDHFTDAEIEQALTVLLAA